ncbi:MAG: PilZ domain-containing protein [Treponema sp.]|jgi:hypothetical protein|nr:PilZ domain-containing protein [Treponema sp.]
MRPYLLQLSQVEIKSSPLDVIGFILVFFLLIALIVFLNVSKKIKNSSVFKGKGVNIKTNLHIVDNNFYKHVKYMGLTKREASVLERVLKETGEDPLAILNNGAKIDECFKYEYAKLIRESHSDEALPDMVELFSIRNALEYFIATENNNLSHNIVRNYRRKNIKSECFFYLVIMTNIRVNSTVKKKLRVETDNRYPGLILNISQGGCALSMANNVKAGNMIKIEFNIGKEHIAALGQILRLNKDGSKWIYHVKFLKLPKKSLVAINAYIFEY